MLYKNIYLQKIISNYFNCSIANFLVIQSDIISTSTYNENKFIKMTEEKYALSSFHDCICSYFSGKCSSGKCFLVKTLSGNVKIDGDFSISLNNGAHKKHYVSHLVNESFVTSQICNYDTAFPQESFMDFKSTGKNLVECSDKWPLKISHFEVKHERLYLHLNKHHTFENILHCILSKGPLYGNSSNINKKIQLTADFRAQDEWAMTMTDYRKNVLRSVLQNILKVTGHFVSLEFREEADYVHYKLSSRHLKRSSKHDLVLVHCGTVLDQTGKTVSVCDYLRQKCEQQREMTHHKYGEQVDRESSWEKFFREIGEATLRIEMMSIRPSRNITLYDQENNQDMSKSAHFILYNCARLAALFEKFDKECTSNIYPPLKDFDEIDVSLLVKEEEWELLAGYLLIYPQVLQKCVEHMEKGNPMPNLLCQFLYSICACYSRYYRRVRVLTEPREHLIPVMFARLYLLKAVEQVLHNGLHILGIEPIRHM